MKKILKDFNSISGSDEFSKALVVQKKELNLPTERRFSMHLSTDKPIYRPGEVIFMRGTVLNSFTHKPCDDYKFFSDPRIMLNLRIYSAGDEKEILKTCQIPKPMKSVVSVSWKIPLPSVQVVPGGRYYAEIEMVSTVEKEEKMVSFAPARRGFFVQSFGQSTNSNTVVWEKGVFFDRRCYWYGETVRMVVYVHGKNDVDFYPSNGRVSIRAKMFQKTFYSKVDEGLLEGCGKAIFSFDLPKLNKREKGWPDALVEITFTPDAEKSTTTQTSTFTRAIPVTLDKIHISFHPEGGSYVKEMVNNVFFDSFTTSGQIVDFEGVVMERVSGEVVEREVCKLATQFFGKGKFSFTPRSGKTKYFVRITKPEKYARNVSLSNVENNTDVNVRVEKGTAFEYGEKISFVIQCTPTLKDKPKRVALFKREVEIDSKKVAIDEDAQSSAYMTCSESLSSRHYDGVLRICVFNKLGIPVCERLVFVKPHDELTFDITADRQCYTQGDKVHLKIVAKSKKTGEVVKCVTNVTVTDQSNFEKGQSVFSQDCKGIMDMYYLEDEVKSLPKFDILGDVDCGGDEKSRDRNLDLLVSCQAWRKFLLVKYYLVKHQQMFLNEYEPKERGRLLRLFNDPDLERWYLFSRYVVRVEELRFLIEELREDLAMIEKKKKWQKKTWKRKKSWLQLKDDLEGAEADPNYGMEQIRKSLFGRKQEMSELYDKITIEEIIQNPSSLVVDEEESGGSSAKNMARGSFKQKDNPRINEIKRKDKDGKNRRGSTSDMDLLRREIQLLEDELSEKDDMLNEMMFSYQTYFVHFLNDERQPDLRNDFTETVYYSGFLEDNPIEIEFDTNDKQNMSFRVEVNGFTPGGVLGYTVKKALIKVIPMFVLRPRIPKIVFAHDVLNIPIYIQNNLERKLIIELKGVFKSMHNTEVKKWERQLEPLQKIEKFFDVSSQETKDEACTQLVVISARTKSLFFDRLEEKYSEILEIVPSGYPKDIVFSTFVKPNEISTLKLEGNKRIEFHLSHSFSVTRATNLMYEVMKGLEFHPAFSLYERCCRIALLQLQNDAHVHEFGVSDTTQTQREIIKSVLEVVDKFYLESTEGVGQCGGFAPYPQHNERDRTCDLFLSAFVFSVCNKAKLEDIKIRVDRLKDFLEAKLVEHVWKSQENIHERLLSLYFYLFCLADRKESEFKYDDLEDLFVETFKTSSAKKDVISISLLGLVVSFYSQNDLVSQCEKLLRSLLGENGSYDFISKEKSLLASALTYIFLEKRSSSTSLSTILEFIVKNFSYGFNEGYSVETIFVASVLMSYFTKTLAENHDLSSQLTRISVTDGIDECSMIDASDALEFIPNEVHYLNDHDDIKIPFHSRFRTYSNKGYYLEGTCPFDLTVRMIRRKIVLGNNTQMKVVLKNKTKNFVEMTLLRVSLPAGMKPIMDELKKNVSEDKSYSHVEVFNESDLCFYFPKIKPIKSYLFSISLKAFIPGVFHFVSRVYSIGQMEETLKFSEEATITVNEK